MVEPKTRGDTVATPANNDEPTKLDHQHDGAPSTLQSGFNGSRHMVDPKRHLSETNDVHSGDTQQQQQQQHHHQEQLKHNDHDNCDPVDELDTRNLDSGYAWVILLIMFLIQSSISGSSRVYGIVYAKEVSIGYYDREQASWPIASASAIENLASILTPALAHYVSWRQIELLSTSLFIMSNLIAYFSDSLWLDILALGCVQGLALSTSTPMSLAINNDYFERYRTTAYGISMSGSTFGVLYLTPIVAWLLQTYENFRLVYLALAVVFAGNLVLVLFIKPRSKTLPKSGPAGEQTARIGAPPAAGAGSASGPPEADEDARDDSVSRSDDRYNLVSIGGELGLADSRCGTPTRKRSRFESHFERQNSIASISYLARARRVSVLEWSVRRGSQASNGLTFRLDDAEHPQPPRPPLEGSRDPDARKPRRVASQRDANLSLIANKLVRINQLNEGQANNMVKSSSSGAELFNLSNQSRQQANQALVHRPTTMGHLEGAGAAAGPEGPAQPISKLATVNSNGLEQPQSETRPAKADKRGLPLAFSDDLEQGARPPTGDQQAEPKPASQEADEFSLEMLKRLIWVPYLHCTWIMLALYYLIARVFIIILVDFADDHGFSLTESTSLLNYWSVGELFGRILLGSLIDLQWMSCKSCITLTCSLLAGAIVAMVLIESYYVYAACSFLVAALISLEYMLINVLMVEYLGKRSVTSCYSLAAGISSLVLFARPSLIGLFRDHLGSYDGLLMLLALVTLAYGLLFQLLEPLLVRKWPKASQQQQQHSQQHEAPSQAVVGPDQHSTKAEASAKL